MTLKEELEIVRGESIEVFEGDPMDIPCIEMSDSKKLCKNPVVSVHMITYNHEPYIRQAIEGVMMQKTDFEFELVIGEDCSQDLTRAICFEYQKKYPDKIRVLWWHENLYKVKHPAGGNGKRVTERCRGEFIAYCEGDDFWTDAEKLQKQVNVMRQFPNVTMVFAAVDVVFEGNQKRLYWAKKIELKRGVVAGSDFIHNMILGKINHCHVQTSGNMVRKSVLQKANAIFDVCSWRLMIGDVTRWLSCAALGDVYYLPEIVSTYRINLNGITQQRFASVMRDSDSVLYYFSRKVLGDSCEATIRLLNKRIVRMWVNKASGLSKSNQKELAYKINECPLLRLAFADAYSHLMLWLMKIGIYTHRNAFWINRMYWYAPRIWSEAKRSV